MAAAFLFLQVRLLRAAGTKNVPARDCGGVGAISVMGFSSLPGNFDGGVNFLGKALPLVSSFGADGSSSLSLVAISATKSSGSNSPSMLEYFYAGFNIAFVAQKSTKTGEKSVQCPSWISHNHFRDLVNKVGTHL